MDKQTFLQILESSILANDGMSFDDMVSKHGISPLIARLGIDVYIYIKNREVRS